MGSLAGFKMACRLDGITAAQNRDHQWAFFCLFCGFDLLIFTFPVRCAEATSSLPVMPPRLLVSAGISLVACHNIMSLPVGFSSFTLHRISFSLPNFTASQPKMGADGMG